MQAAAHVSIPAQTDTMTKLKRRNKRKKPKVELILCNDLGSRLDDTNVRAFIKALKVYVKARFKLDFRPTPLQQWLAKKGPKSNEV